MNWPAMVRRAALEFALPPDRLWALSVKEWRALAGPMAAEPLSRADLEALAHTYPDGHPGSPGSGDDAVEEKRA